MEFKLLPMPSGVWRLKFFEHFLKGERDFDMVDGRASLTSVMAPVQSAIPS
jgi:hypothetical protein